MIRRKRIVQARLTWEEQERFEPLIKQRSLWTWSDLIRTALESYWQSLQPPPSDNGVIQRAHEKKQRPARPVVVPKRYRPSLPAAKKTVK
jgi:hypothetical protein